MSAIKRTNKWWIDFSYLGIRYRLPSPENSRNGAKSYEALLRQRLSKGEPMFPKSIPKSPVFKEFAEKWFESYVKINNKPSAIKSKKTHLGSALIPFFGKKRLNEIGGLEIEEFKANQLKHSSPKTVNNQLGTLQKCLRTAIDWGDLDKLPNIKSLRTNPPDFDYLSEEEANKLLSSATGAYKTAILLALHTGMRFGELMALNWTNIDFTQKQISIKQSFSAGILGSTKSNRIRYVPMTNDLYDHLITIEPKDGFVLKGPDGIRLRPECSRTKIHDILDKAGLRQMGWHKLRHTFASRLAEKGVSMNAIQNLMGHSDIRTTMRYAHLGQHTLRDAIKVLETPQKINVRHNSVTIDNFGVQNIALKNQNNFSNNK